MRALPLSLLFVLQSLSPFPTAGGEIPFADARALAPDLVISAAAFGDLDDDGAPDAVVVVGSAGTVGRLVNPGDGSSPWAYEILDAGLGGARAVTVGDVDRDGDLDVVAATEAAGVVWLENPDDGISPWIRRDVDGAFAGGEDVTLVDLDGDGKLDVAAAGGSGEDRVRVWLNVAGDGSSWSARTALDVLDARSVTAADLDEDGDPDLLAASFFPSRVVLGANAAAGFTAVPVADNYAGATDAVVADVDGDGDPDVLQAAATLGAYVWIENASGDATTWVERPVATGEPGPVAVVAADLDADGDVDVLGADGRTFEVSWWENGGGGASWTRHVVEERKILAGKPPREDRDLAALDLDGDGDLDVAAGAGRGGSLTWWENLTYHRGARFGEEQAVTVDLDAAMGMRPADLDGDGDMDLAGTAWRDNQILWWENAAGDGSVWTEHVLGTDLDGARDVFPVDLDRDGDLDILSTVFWDKRVLWWENLEGDASAWRPRDIDGDFDGARSIFPADIDGDGDSDVLGVALLDDTVAWWENSGDASAWTRRTIATALDGAGWTYAADLDADGDVDAVVAAAEADRVSWFENTAGDGSAWTEHLLRTGFQDANYVDVTDMDGDGDLDVLASALFGDRVSWWENPGRPGEPFPEHVVDADYLGPYTVIGADLDADGDQDVAVAALFGNRVSWWENTSGDARAWEEHLVQGNFPWGRTIRAVDLDGDGLLDLAGTASNGDRVSWWRNLGGQYALRTVDAVAGARPAEGTPDVPMLHLEVRHRGRSADGSLELSELRLRLEKGGGAVLSPAEAAAVAPTIRIYRDDGDGVLDAALDAPVAAAAPTDPADLVLVPAGSGARIAPGATGLFFLTVDLGPSANGAVPGGFRLVHRENRLQARGGGVGLRGEPGETVSSGFLIPRAAP